MRHGLWILWKEMEFSWNFHLFLLKKKTEMFADSKIFRIFAAIIHYAKK